MLFILRARPICPHLPPPAPRSTLCPSLSSVGPGKLTSVDHRAVSASATTLCSGFQLGPATGRHQKSSELEKGDVKHEPSPLPSAPAARQPLCVFQLCSRCSLCYSFGSSSAAANPWVLLQPWLVPATLPTSL